MLENPMYLTDPDETAGASEFDERLKQFAKTHDACPECHNPLKHYHSPSGTGNCWANHHPGCAVWDSYVEFGTVERYARKISREGWLFPRWLRLLLNRIDGA